MKLIIRINDWMNVIEQYNAFQLTDDEYLEFLEDYGLDKYVFNAYRVYDHKERLINPQLNLIGCSIQICCMFWNTMMVEQAVVTQLKSWELNDVYQEFIYKYEYSELKEDLINKEGILGDVKTIQTYVDVKQNYDENLSIMRNQIKFCSFEHHKHKAEVLVYVVLDENYNGKIWIFEPKKKNENIIQDESAYLNRVAKSLDCSYIKKWWLMK